MLSVVYDFFHWGGSGIAWGQSWDKTIESQTNEYWLNCLNHTINLIDNRNIEFTFCAWFWTMHPKCKKFTQNGCQTAGLETFNSYKSCRNVTSPDFKTFNAVCKTNVLPKWLFICVWVEGTVSVPFHNFIVILFQ